MADKMMRIAGRSVDGKAKAIKTSEDGVVCSNIAKDPATGNPVELSAIQDQLGNWVLRTVKAAEVAYDDVNDAFKTININDNFLDTTGTILKSHTITESGYVGNTFSSDILVVENLDISTYKDIGIIIKNNDLSATAKIKQVVLTTFSGAGASDYTAGKARGIYTITGVEVAPEAVYVTTLSELLKNGTPGNATTEIIGDWIKQFKTAFSICIAYIRTENGSYDISLIGGK